MCAEAGETEREAAIATSNFQHFRAGPVGYTAKGGDLSAFGIDLNGHLPLRDWKYTAARRGCSIPAATPNGLEMSRPASSRILLDEPRPQLAGSAPSSC
jgi:hypothetical protein